MPDPVPDLWQSLPPGRPVLELAGVTHHYGVRPVLSDLSFAVGRGEVVVVVGPNGTGKSTLLGVLGGVCHPTVGCAA